MKRLRKPYAISLALLSLTGLLAGLTACKKERAFVGIWRAETAGETSTDIHNVLIFGDLTCSWQDSILNLADSVWQLGQMDGTGRLESDEILQVSFVKKSGSDTIPPTIFQYTFHKADDRQLYCQALELHFKRVRRLR